MRLPEITKNKKNTKNKKRKKNEEHGIYLYTSFDSFIYKDVEDGGGTLFRGIIA